MSQNIPEKLPTCLVVDPICDFVQPCYAVEKAPQINNFYNITSNNTSTANTTFSIPINSADTIVDRVFLLDMTLNMTVTFSAAVADLSNLFALRSFPLNKWAQSITVTVGNASNTIQIGDMMNCFERYGLMDKYLNYSMTPVYPDLVSSYNLAAGLNVNPLGLYANTMDKVMPRGAFPLVNITSVPTAGLFNFTFTVNLIEPLFISPFLQNLCDRKQGFSHLQYIQVQINWGQPSRLVSINPNLAGPTVTNVAVNSLSPSIMRVQQFIPGLIDLHAPPVQTLPYDEIVAYSTASQMLTSGSATVAPPVGQPFNSPTIQLSRIPKEIYIFCRRQNADYSQLNNSVGILPIGPSLPDVFASLPLATGAGNLVITFNGQTFFSGASNAAIYKACRENGCNLSFTEWIGSATKSLVAIDNYTTMTQGTVGSVICLKFGKDISLTNASYAPGCNIKANLQVSANFANNADIASAGALFQMWVVVAYEGAWSFYGTNTVAQTAACLSEQDVLEAIKQNNRVHYDVSRDEAVGGNIFDKGRHFLQSGKLQEWIEKIKNVLNNDTYKSISKGVKEHLRKEGPSAVADVADSLGLGSVGGKNMSKAQLKRMLMN